MRRNLLDEWYYEAYIVKVQAAKPTQLFFFAVLGIIAIFFLKIDIISFMCTAGETLFCWGNFFKRALICLYALFG